ncbi:alpha/beta hydrolase-fold protein [Flavobacteriaceae bacterium]|nr:alpha/beta hydrolase-fold protein [Flavobacteriaceae bacterium]
MKKNIGLHLLFLLLTVSCSSDNYKGNSNACFSNQNPETMLHSGETREYILYIPSSYRSSNPVPVVLNFHGFGGSASEYSSYADMREEAEANSFILVYPQGSCLNNTSHWNPCPVGGDNKSTADDLGFIDSLISKISNEYSIDNQRVYAVGYSNGGMMAYGLANYKSNLIAAVASVSGVQLSCGSSNSSPMPVVHLHGTSDDVIPYEGNNDYNSAQSVLDYWINFNNTAIQPDVNSESTVEHYIYSQGDDGVRVEHFKYIGGEHIWFNTNYQGKSTSQIIWNFVSRFDRNGLRD